MSLVVRPAGVTDVPALVALHAQLHADHVRAEPWWYRPVAGDEVATWFAACLGEGWRVHIAEVEGRPVGYALLRIQDRRETPFTHGRRILLVDQLVVDGAARRQGVGRALLDAAREDARQLDVDGIELDVRAWNEAARGLYEAVGFAPAALRLAWPREG